jgi:LCP family protein required for cell wall assembly
MANEDGLAALGAEIDGRQRPPRRRGRTRASRRVRRRRILVGLMAVVLLIVGIFGGGYLYLRYRFDQIKKISVGTETAYHGGPINLLVIGSDSRANLSTGQQAQAGSATGSGAVTGQRSDVDMIWHVDPATHQITILSIPRDTLVSMGSGLSDQFGTYNRINSAFNSGPAQLVKVIQDNFGIPINDTVQVDFNGFEGAVNALGGVKMNFPYPARDAFSGLSSPLPGCRLLSGAEALSVARSRHFQYYENGYWHSDPTGDYGRIQRQDAFLKALVSSAKSKVNPLTINAFLGSIPHGVSLDTSLSLSTLVSLGLSFHSFNPNALGSVTLPTMSDGYVSPWGDVLFVDQPAAQEMLVGIFGSGLNLRPVAPPPNTALESVQPPAVTTTTAPASTTTKSNVKPTATTAPVVTTTAPPSYNPVAC